MLVLIALLVSSCLFEFGFGANVWDLSSEDELQAILKSEEPWLVEFSDGGNRRDALEELAGILEGSGVKVAVVSLDETSSTENPGLKLFGPDKTKPKPLAVGHAKIDVAKVAKKALDEVQNAILARLKGKESSEEETRKKEKKQSSPPPTGPLELDDHNFDDIVKSTDEAFMVGFLAPWCGHCQRLKPEWEKAARELVDSGVVIASVDATANDDLARRFRVQGFPTIKFFPPGRENKDDSMAIDYQGPREADGIVAWARNEFEKRGGKVTIDIPEVISQEIFEDLCEKKSKCLLAVLPNLLDSGKGGREGFISTLEDAQRSARHIKIGWIEAGAQPALEEAFQMNFGFPAVLMLRKHEGKNLGIVMKGSSFTPAALSSFASAGKKLGDFLETKWPPIQETIPWDGEEALPPQEDDDFDLDAFLAED